MKIQHPFKSNNFDHLKTLDIIFTSNGKLTQFIARCVWNHVAIIYREPLHQIPYVFEITMGASPLKLVQRTFKPPSIRFIPLVTFVKRHTKHKAKKIIFRSLIATRTDTQEKLNQWRENPACVEQYIQEHWNYSFSYNILHNAMYRVFSFMSQALSQEKHTSQYCAQFVELLYKRLHILQSSIVSQVVLPSDFATYPNHSILHFYPGFTLGEPTLLI